MDWQKRMIIREEFRNRRIAMAETEEMSPMEHFREEIDQINMRTSLLVIRMGDRIIGIIMMGI